MPKITLDTTRLLSVEFLLMGAISLGSAYAAFSAWKSDANARMVQLEAQSVISKKDHDLIIKMGADIDYIKQAIERIEKGLPVQKASAQ
jgi:hypothetical protein